MSFKFQHSVDSIIEAYPRDDRLYTRCASDEAEDNIDKSGVYVQLEYEFNLIKWLASSLAELISPSRHPRTKKRAKILVMNINDRSFNFSVYRRNIGNIIFRFQHFFDDFNQLTIETNIYIDWNQHWSILSL